MGESRKAEEKGLVVREVVGPTGMHSCMVFLKIAALRLGCRAAG